MDKKSVMKNYAFLAILLGAMVLGCIVGWLAPGFRFYLHFRCLHQEPRSCR